MCELPKSSSRKRFRAGGTAWGNTLNFFNTFNNDVLIQYP
jgi:hypothetical protein